MLDQDLLDEIEEHSILQSFNEGDWIVKHGQVIRFVPIIKSGCAKVFCQEEEKEFLLYFISSGESCIHSFAHMEGDALASFSAIAESESQILLLPIDKVRYWTRKYASLNGLIIQGYQRHYLELLDTTKQILCYKLEDRLIKYLRTKAELAERPEINITHQEIAKDLGTSREVISRLMKSSSLQAVAIQEGRKIKMV